MLCFIYLFSYFFRVTAACKLTCRLPKCHPLPYAAQVILKESMASNYGPIPS